MKLPTAEQLQQPDLRDFIQPSPEVPISGLAWEHFEYLKELPFYDRETGHFFNDLRISNDILIDVSFPELGFPLENEIVELIIKQKWAEPAVIHQAYQAMATYFDPKQSQWPDSLRKDGSARNSSDFGSAKLWAALLEFELGNQKRAKRLWKNIKADYYDPTYNLWFYKPLSKLPVVGQPLPSYILEDQLVACLAMCAAGHPNRGAAPYDWYRMITPANSYKFVFRDNLWIMSQIDQPGFIRTQAQLLDVLLNLKLGRVDEALVHYQALKKVGLYDEAFKLWRPSKTLGLEGGLSNNVFGLDQLLEVLILQEFEVRGVDPHRPSPTNEDTLPDVIKYPLRD